ncbi:hypothetical protein [Streptomyces sp. H39-S7]|uniref:hypothetical protein n=1 Tax=Streptomyces sp. H39-S7 TaxID=3004357 RepID=UPI0022AF5AB9|nr:hypothetical protein [Streptomyces sp. H39-S7]MCZ4117826.1 hypothetical protein [Streptomyces sp. H39-S7]
MSATPLDAMPPTRSTPGFSDQRAGSVRGKVNAILAVMADTVIADGPYPQGKPHPLLPDLADLLSAAAEFGRATLEARVARKAGLIPGLGIAENRA